jgi:hypothetical protein
MTLSQVGYKYNLFYFSNKKITVKRKKRLSQKSVIAGLTRNPLIVVNHY